MAIEQGPPFEGAPNSISINLGQSEKKEAHVCIFDGCTRGKRGYSDYCRKHKAIGKIVTEKIVRETEKIAREKAINVDSSTLMYEESLRIQELESLPIQESVHIKSQYHCRFGDCQNQRKGYSDFCGEHKAIGKIIAGKIAREKAIAKISERENQGQVTETDPRPSPLSSNYSPSIYTKADNSEDNQSFGVLGASVAYIFITLFLIFGAESLTEDEVFFGMCFALPIAIIALGSAIKDPILRALVMMIIIPVTIFLSFYIFMAWLFASYSGGCYGVCGLSGWGGP